ncbi:hypothetical protein N9L68_03770 [bacterium]|nr:hypothetical protein [bacterium]
MSELPSTFSWSLRSTDPFECTIPTSNRNSIELIGDTETMCTPIPGETSSSTSKGYVRIFYGVNNEYDLYDGENYEAEHYGRGHWHLRADVAPLLARHRLAKGREARDCLERTRSDKLFRSNRFRRWWVNLNVIASFWRLLSGFQSVSVSLKLQGLQARLREVAELHPSTIAAAPKYKEQPGTTKAV